MKYLHEKMEDAILDGKKISIENQTNLVELDGISSSCGPECFLIFGLMLLLAGINHL